MNSDKVFVRKRNFSNQYLIGGRTPLFTEDILKAKIYDRKLVL